MRKARIMVYVFLADGHEEIEALAPVDVMRRAGIEVKTVGIGKKDIMGAHDIEIKADITESEINKENIEAIFLPGGGVGTKNLEKSDTVQDMITYALENDIIISAICAAPSILGHRGILKGKEATSYPSFQSELEGAKISDKYVVRDGNIITGRGMGVAVDFGLELIKALRGEEKSDEIREQIQCER